MSSRERHTRGSHHGASRYSDSGFSSSSGRQANPGIYTEFDSRLQFHNLEGLQDAYRQLWDEKEKLKASCTRYESELANKRAPTPEMDTIRKQRATNDQLTDEIAKLIKEKKGLAKEIETLRKDNAGLLETIKQRDAKLKATEEDLVVAQARSVRYKEERNAALTAMDGKIRSGSSGSSSDRKKEKEKAKEEKARLGQRFVREDNKTVEHTLPTRQRRMSRVEREPPYIEDEMLPRTSNYSTTATTGGSRMASTGTTYQAPRSHTMEAAADNWNARHVDNGMYNPIPIPRQKGSK
ncbi:hypothetical protein MCOR25_010816 [Pyricularia grisea]|uniref:Uncharacterized protein n=1 Tax=Pyricularia grisea TaxID=148305 RepID=A0A6P8B0T8_PYRGI|nr:uncharacterized protein PgNI_07017 [Pyricularia grisea]KAI6348346.1 hypothetical protein MCOR25_010816 [Pyricularia grisea]TLD08520.1 hypothetical protein PgNI_07017 [Pyricularia grisea]